jgi:hypothetical protein
MSGSMTIFSSTLSSQKSSGIKNMTKVKRITRNVRQDTIPCLRKSIARYSHAILKRSLLKRSLSVSLLGLVVIQIRGLLQLVTFGPSKKRTLAQTKILYFFYCKINTFFHLNFFQFYFSTVNSFKLDNVKPSWVPNQCVSKN